MLSQPALRSSTEGEMRGPLLLQDERLLDMLGDMRSKFKIVANALKMMDVSTGQLSPLPSHARPTAGHDAADLHF